MKVNILGTEYEVVLEVEEKDDSNLKNADGYMDYTLKKIVVAKIVPDDLSLGDLRIYTNKVLRHEIVHAFLAESGLRECSGPVDSWAQCEEIVDWIAIQFPKILKAFQCCNCI